MIKRLFIYFLRYFGIYKMDIINIDPKYSLFLMAVLLEHKNRFIVIPKKLFMLDFNNYFITQYNDDDNNNIILALNEKEDKLKNG